jgi:hypothetical protein
VKVTRWRYVMAVLSRMRGACIGCVCVWAPLAGGFPEPGLCPSSLGCVYFPYLCVDKVLAMMYDA